MLRKTLCTALSAVLFIAMLAGCGSPGATPGSSAPPAVSPGTGGTSAPSETGHAYNGNDVSEPLQLTAYVLGDMPADGQLVYDKVNEILQKAVNATIEWKYLSWAEHGTKYALLFTGQEDFDLIFTAPLWAHYEETVGMGGFEPLTPEFVQKYAPGIWSIVPEEAWEQTKVSGVSYCVPSSEAVLRSDVNAVRGDLMEKAGITDITTFDQLLAFFDWVAKHQNETGVSPLGAAKGGFLYSYFPHNDLALLSGMPYEILYYNYLDADNYEVEYLLDQPWFKGYCEDMKKYYEAGWWSQDSLASTSTFQENFLRGQAASFGWNIGSVINFLRQADAEHPEWKVTFVDAELEAHKWVEAFNNNDMAINAFSKKKERAMMALNELYSNVEANRLIRYGIEGVHYTLVDDKYYKLTDKNGNYPIDGNCPAWAMKNPVSKLEQFIENPTVYEAKEKEVRKVWEQHRVPYHGLNQFTLDTANITTQIAMISALKDQYFTPLISGMAGDVDKAIAALRQQLEQAGIKDVIAEAQRQANERINSK